jgi:tetratricopeptide (TPR) repeat protein
MNRIKISIVLTTLLFISGFGFSQQSIDDAKKLTVREQYTQAAELYQKLIDASPSNGDLYYFFGENELYALFSDTVTLSQSETLKKCKNIFKEGVDNDPGNPMNYIGLARLDYIAGNKNGVNENVAKVNTMIPLMTAKIKKIENPARYAAVLNEMAKIYILVGNTDTTSAFPLLRRAVQADPKNAQILITWGDAYLNIKDVNKAIEDYNAAQVLDPNSPLAKLRIGYLYVRAKNLNEAIKYFEEALKIDPKFAPVYKELGFLYSRAGNADKSKANYLKYLELSGNNIPAKMAYAIALFKAGDYASCINVINEIFAVDPSINSMNRVIAYAYYEEKQFANAQTHIEKFLENLKGDESKIIPRDYSYYGRILGELGKADKADEYLRKAINLDPTMTNLYSDIATYQNKAKNYTKATDALNDKIKAGNAKVVDYYNLGKYYYSAGDYVNSDKTFETLLAMNDPKVKAYEMLALSYQGGARYWIDTTFETGYAVPVYEKLIEKSKLDSTKYSKYLLQGYSYLGNFYLRSKTKFDYGKSKFYYLKVIAINPDDETAKLALLTKELLNAKLPENE